MTTIEYLASLNHCDENVRMTKKLPTYLQERWNRKVVKFQNQGDVLWDGRFLQGYPPFIEYCIFVGAEVQVVEGPCCASNAPEAELDHTTDGSRGKLAKKRPAAAVTTFQTKTRATPTKPQGARPPLVPYCVYCKKEQHFISQCDVFLKLASDVKTEFAKTNHLCFGCLRKHHQYKTCRSKNPALLKDVKHANVGATQADADDESIDDTESDGMSVAESSEGHEMKAHVMKVQLGTKVRHSTMILPVQLVNRKNGRAVIVYALQDTQSDCCMISEYVAEALQLEQEPVNLKLTTVSVTEYVSSTVVQGLSIQGLSEKKRVQLPACFTRPIIPCDRSAIPRREEALKWPHLAEMGDKLHPYRDDWPAGILIGFNRASLLRQKAWVSGDEEEPYGVYTDLGWSVMGAMTLDGRKASPQSTCLVTSAQTTTLQEMRDVFDADFVAQTGERMSRDDQQFIDVLTAGMEQLPNKHFQMPLPFRSANTTMPNNQYIAEQSAIRMKRRFGTDEKYKADFVAAMQVNIDKGYVERVPQEELLLDDGTVNFLTFHGVYHPQKKKFRPVFNASLRFKNVSLNDLLLSGPDLTNNLTGVLCRFREEMIVVSCDIEGMFYQVYVKPEHRNFLRFLWYEDSDITGPLVEYRFQVHTFGVTSSPGCSNLALKTTADRYEHIHGKMAADFIRRFFYVDDGFRGVPDVATGVELITSSHELALEGGFNLHKYLSNSREVLAQIPKKLLAQEIQQIDFLKKSQELPLGRTLGCLWYLESDELQFRIQLTSSPLTRRVMLSTLGSVYDPLGFVSPVLLRGRNLLQSICTKEFHWDDPVPSGVGEQWNQWIRELQELQNCRVDRCFRKGLVGELQSVQLHSFSDASFKGHGCCSYLRLQDYEGNVNVSLVMAKAKVNPLKTVTIPRLELQSAVLSVVLSEFLSRELTYQSMQLHFWSDSMVVLGYLQNASKRFHVYVSNRIQRIHDSTSPKQWHHVRSEDNPADIASRGIAACELASHPIWWKGPSYLLDFEEEEIEEVEYNTAPQDPELKKEQVVLATKVEMDSGFSVMQCLERVSDWEKLVRYIVIWKKYIERLRALVTKSGVVGSNRVTVKEIQWAQTFVLKCMQKAVFPKEYNMLSDYPFDRSDIRTRNKRIQKSSNLFRLDPYVEAELLKVGGRIQRADLPVAIIHPILLPKYHHLTTLIIRSSHEAVAHSGLGITLNHVRSRGFWILQSRVAIRHILKDCTVCAKLHGKPAVQIMADLPLDRLQHHVPPFTFCGVDLFGPVTIKRGRVEVKRWIVLYTCMVARAIHLDVVPTLTTDSFLNSYRRFVCHRGPVQLLRCDQGTNFVGAHNELRKALESMDDYKIEKELAKDGCEWIQFQFNSPKASYQGGAWERMIGVTKRIFLGLLQMHGQRIDEELLTTLMMEAENIVNTRPITYQDTSSPEENVTLSPSQLLTMKNRAVLPFPGKFIRQDLYCRKRWRVVQHLADAFWKQWIKAYVPTLQERQKWSISRQNLHVDDLVIIVDENSPRNNWPLGRILELIVDADQGVQRVKIRTSGTVLERPIQKVILLLRPKPSRSQGDSQSRSQD